MIGLGFEADTAGLEGVFGGGFVLGREGEIDVELEFVGFGGGQVA